MINNRSTKKTIFFFLAIVLSVSIATGIVVGQSMVYHGNSKSHIFHKPGCRYYNCKKCTVEFTTREDAISAGYRPCKVCKP